MRRTRSFSYAEALAFLIERGVDEEAVHIGTIHEDSVSFLRKAVATHCERRPLRALHVGNFVGVSLAALSDVVIRHHPESVLVSVDPNLPHLGTEDPQSHVLALLDHFGLQRNNIVIPGYSLHRVANRTQAGTFADEPAGEHTLENLERLGVRFDLALIDGNHDLEYVRGELELLVRLLPGEALLMLDDIANEHTRIPELFEEVVAGRWPFEQVDRDRRIGVLRRTSP